MTTAGFQRTWRVLLIIVLLVGLGGTGCATDADKRSDAHKQSEYHYNLATSYFQEKHIPQAIRELILALEVNPKNEDAHHLLGFIYMGRRDYSRAIHHFRTALELKEDFHICRNNLGTAYLASERWDEAIDTYDKLIANPMYNTPELAYNNVGWAYLNLGQHDRARDAFEMAVFLKPEMCLAHNNLGIVHTKQGNARNAARSFREAIEGCPTYAEPNFHLAQLLRTTQSPDARFYYERCFELAAKSSWGDRCRSYLEVYP